MHRRKERAKRQTMQSKYRPVGQILLMAPVCSCWGVPAPNPARITKGVDAYLKDPETKQRRTRVVRTRMTEDEYDYFLEHCETYGLTQSEMIRKALEGKIIRPVIRLCPVNERVLTALNALIAESQRIGNNLNQIARVLNAGEIMPRLAVDLQMLHGELRDWKYRMLRQVGEILGNDQTYQL